MSLNPFKSDHLKIIYEKTYDINAKKWPIDSECHTIDTTIGTSYVRISGAVNKKTIILLPSAATTSLMWSNIAYDLVKTGYRVVSIDNIHEFGRSFYSSKIANTSTLVDWLDETLQQLKITENVELMGHSLGAWLCAQYALAHPVKIRRLTLLAPFMTICLPRLGVISRLLLLLAIPAAFLRKRFCYWYYNNAWNGNADAHLMVERWATELNLGFTCFKLKKPAKMNLINVEQLKSIQDKTGIMLGLRDRGIQSRKIINILHENAYNGELEVIADTGHDLPFTHSNRIIEFLQRN